MSAFPDENDDDDNVRQAPTLETACYRCYLHIKSALLHNNDDDDDDDDDDDCSITRRALYKSDCAIVKSAAFERWAEELVQRFKGNRDYAHPNDKWDLGAPHPYRNAVAFFYRQRHALALAARIYAQCAAKVLELYERDELTVPAAAAGIGHVQLAQLRLARDAAPFFRFVANVAEDAMEAIDDYDRCVAQAASHDALEKYDCCVAQAASHDALEKYDCCVAQAASHDALEKLGISACDSLYFHGPRSPAPLSFTIVDDDGDSGSGCSKDEDDDDATYYRHPKGDGSGAMYRACCRRSIRQLVQQAPNFLPFFGAVKAVRDMALVGGRHTECCVALAMGRHARLGEHSIIAVLPAEIFADIIVDKVLGRRRSADGTANNADAAQVALLCNMTSSAALKTCVEKQGLEAARDTLLSSRWASAMHNMLIINSIVRGEAWVLQQPQLAPWLFQPDGSLFGTHFAPSMWNLVARIMPLAELISEAVTKLVQDAPQGTLDKEAYAPLLLQTHLFSAARNLQLKLSAASVQCMQADTLFKEQRAQIAADSLPYRTLRKTLRRTMRTSSNLPTRANELASLFFAMQAFEHHYNLCKSMWLLGT